ncbi:uncharacterized protein LOC133189288 [Saccostrea echinata]|uniref:uncharacterized protein LOC133189288 n=1 Tax=Saccostrea echinata TaxID=191078 RepID=UPI002A7EFE46|nr:uncharacterized protein LOC133189288 [Saccostrea echinata]
MATVPDPRGQHFVTCESCEDNVQFYCRPCKIRLCVKCVSPHLETNAPDHNIIYYHKRFDTPTKYFYDPFTIRKIPGGNQTMHCIKYAGNDQIYYCSQGSFDIELFLTDGTSVYTFSSQSLPSHLTPYEDGVLYTVAEEIRKINFEGDETFLHIDGWLRGIEFVEPNFIFFCNSSKVEKYTTGGERLLKIKYNDQGQPIYSSINRNGDICVSEYDATGYDDPVVTVVDEFGKYRFSYYPDPSSWPMDLCCDSCCHIIIASSTIHVIGKYGNFLRYLAYDGIKHPCSVTIDSEDNLFVSEMSDGHIRMVQYLYKPVLKSNNS